MKINRKLLPIKSHFFLQYAGSSFLSMVLPLVVRHKGVSPQGIGILFTAMPIVGLIVNSLSGTLADYYRAHRAIFLVAIASLTCGLVSVYCLPDIPTYGVRHYDALQGPLSNITFKKVIGSSSLQNAPEMTTTNTSDLGFPETIRAPVEAMKIVSSTSFEGNDLMGDDARILLNTDPEIAFEEGHIAHSGPRITEGKEDDGGQASNNSSFSYFTKLPQFWFILMGVMCAHVGLNLCIMMADAVCFLMLGPERHKYGKQRLWGTVGMGIMAVVVGAIVDQYSDGLSRPNYIPAVVICGVLMAMDFGVVATMNIPYSKDLKVKMNDVGSVLVLPQVLLSLVAIYVTGMSLGILWVFKMMMIEDVTSSWDPNFSNLKLLQGLDLGIETFGGEMPFFFLSGMIIQKFGYTAVFTISMASMGLRCCLYYVIKNPWWFLPVELLNGLSYGLFHTVMASYASYVAPPGTQATFQAIVRASFAIGLSTVGYFGGHLYSSGLLFLSVGLFNFAFCFLFTILSFVFSKYCNHTNVSGEEEEEEEDVAPELRPLPSSEGKGRPLHTYGEGTPPLQPFIEDV